MPKQVWPKEPVRDNFNSSALGLPWNFIRNPHDADWSLIEKPGYLRLKGSKVSLKEKDSPAFIGRRQPGFNMVASAKLSFVPTAPNEEAGLAVRGDDANHFDLAVTMLAGKKVVMLRKYLQDKITSLNYKEISDGDITLRISATDLQYQFWAQEKDKPAVLLGTAATKDISTEIRGGFIGAFVGMYASGNDAANKNPADFDWFDLEEEPALPYSWAAGAKESLSQMATPEITSLSSTAFDNATINWTNVPGATGYIIERYVNNKFQSVGTAKAGEPAFTDKSLSGKTMYVYRVTAQNGDKYSYPSVATSVWTMPKPGPYSGYPAQIPGKIEAENFDYGKKGEAYYDTDENNKGEKYRSGGVDIGGCWDKDGGNAIGWIDNGEWLAYTVDVNETLVNIELRVLTWGNNVGHIKLELDGTKISEADIPHTEGKWITVTLNNVKLEKGQNKKLKVVFDKGGFDLNWMNFIKAN